jgi:hypothetical protein
MKHKLAILLDAVALVGSLPAPRPRAGPNTPSISRTTTRTNTFAPGEGPCVSWPGTFHEVRSGGYRLVTPPGGQIEGEFPRQRRHRRPGRTDPRRGRAAEVLRHIPREGERGGDSHNLPIRLESDVTSLGHR